MIKDILIKKGYKQIPLNKTIVDVFELEVSIDGLVTYFLLDTGAGNTVIDIGFARINNLEFSETDIIGGGVGTSKLGIHKKKINNLKLNGFAIKDFQLYGADFKHVKDSLIKKGIQNPANGVLGADVLIKYKAVIDYENECMYLKQ